MSVNRPRPRQFSERHQDIIRLVASGLTNSDIAQILNLAHSTVKNHLSSIFSVAEVQDRAQLTLFAIREGFLSVDEAYETMRIYYPANRGRNEKRGSG